MGFRNIFSFAKPRNVWNAVKRGVGNIYNPIKKITKGISKFSHGVDSLLDKANSFGVPQSLIDLIRDNPIYSTVHDVIEFADDLVEKDLPRLGGAVENFVEHNIFQQHAPSSGQPTESSARSLSEIPSQAIPNRPSFGFTPNRGPTSTQAFTGSTAA